MTVRRTLVLYGALAATVAASIWAASVEVPEAAPSPTAARIVLADGSARGSGNGLDAAGGSLMPPPPRAASRNDMPSTYRLPQRPAPGAEPRDARDVFAAYSWAPPAPAPLSPEQQPPVTPPVPFTYTGQMQIEGAKRYLLAEGLRTHIVSVGEEVGDFRLDSADDSQLVFVHVPTKGRQVLSMSK